MHKEFTISLDADLRKTIMRKRGCMECYRCKKKDYGLCTNCRDVEKVWGLGAKQKSIHRVCTGNVAKGLGRPIKENMQEGRRTDSRQAFAWSHGSYK